MPKVVCTEFQNIKSNILNRTDLSLKGSIDEPIKGLVDFINQNPNFCTTSTCSGRVTIIEKSVGGSGKKQNTKFHLRSHDRITFQDVNIIVQEFLKSCVDEDQCLWLKFEPFIAHILCCDLSRSKDILKIALASGCRNSGVTFSKHESSYLVAIRSTSTMEVPICCGLKLRPEENFLRFLCDESNRRMSGNLERLEKFRNNLFEDL